MPGVGGLKRYKQTFLHYVFQWQSFGRSLTLGVYSNTLPTPGSATGIEKRSGNRLCIRSWMKIKMQIFKNAVWFVHIIQEEGIPWMSPSFTLHKVTLSFYRPINNFGTVTWILPRPKDLQVASLSDEEKDPCATILHSGNNSGRMLPNRNINCIRMLLRGMF